MKEIKKKALAEVVKAGNKLEKYNWHTIAPLPESIYERIIPFIKKDKELEVAKIIRKEFDFFKMNRHHLRNLRRRSNL